MSKLNRVLYILAFIKAVLPFFLQHASYEPHRDEFLYLAEGHHLAWGYMEVPPLLSVFAWITNMMGGGMFWIKVWPALFGALTFLLVGKLILSLKGNMFALFLGWLPFVVDGYMGLFFLFQPNFLEVFFWTLQAYSLLRYVQTGRDRYLYIWGLAAGLGMMSKYSVAFYSLSLLAGLLATRQRTVFRNKHLYIAAGIALVIFLPNVWWQYAHRFPVVKHMTELKQEQLRYVSASSFLVSQLMMNLPCLFVWLAGLLFVARRTQGRLFRFIGWAYLFVIVLLVVLHGKDYYSLGAYPVLFALGAVHIEMVTQRRARWVRYALLVMILGLGSYALPLILPVAPPATLANYYVKSGLAKTGSFKWEGADTVHHTLPQDFADMIGWREMTGKVARVYHQLPAAEQPATAIVCRAYCWAGALNYYGPSLGLPEVYSSDATFRLWLPDRLPAQNILLIGHDYPDTSDVLFRQFASCQTMDTLVNPLARENGVHVFLLQQPRPQTDAMISKAIHYLKSEFTR